MFLAEMDKTSASVSTKVSQIIAVIISPLELQSELISEKILQVMGHATLIISKPSSKKIRPYLDHTLVFLIDCHRMDFQEIMLHLASTNEAISEFYPTKYWASFNLRTDLQGFIEKELMQAGCKGVFFEKDGIEYFIKGIQDILKGNLWFSRQAMNDALTTTRLPTPVFEEKRITKREKDILIRLIAGESNQKIAEGMGISIHTVKSHLHSVYKKIGVTSRIKAANWGAKNFSLL
ncbi:regulatory LuxR family protein [Desulfobotulus alkaliphilus]|uniref:Regulatory LuxR family protein n=1 Tax=Desulfobotulus alkaliphilus TaxID=622671 RepID=A0A562S9L6_9BACT|nr:LuxR C-terminal-related transcriptional regulator [Desulfobotulus alkaliphilus]TWI77230.1 regulatory LuxR family protein [Desulfobotulus alkaliphilus]